MTDSRSVVTFRDHISTLDGLRGVAVLMVLWGHSLPLINGLYQLTGLRIGMAYLGVELFFVLSGFLITRILIYDRQKGSPLRFFLARRFLRIFPIYYLTLAIIWIVWRDPLAGWSAVYLSNYYMSFHPGHSLLSHTWSLAVEEHFYLVWPLAVYGLSHAWARGMAQWGFPILGIGSAIVFALFGDRLPVSDLVYHASNCRMISLGIGAALAFHEAPIRAMQKRGILLTGLAALAGVLVQNVLPRVLPRNYAAVVSMTGFAIVSGAVTVAVIRLRASGWGVVALLRSGWLRYVGKVSYGLYLYHFPIFVLMGIRGERSGASFYIWNLAAIALALLVAAASFRWIETPILALKSRFDVRKTQHAPHPPVPAPAPTTAP